MKDLFIILTSVIFGTLCGVILQASVHPWHTDNQVAVGEWKISVQTPPCDSAKNIQVNYPAHSSEPLTIECDLMPVPEK